MCETTIPTLLFPYIYIPSIVLMVGLGLFVLFKNYGERLNRYFFLISLVIATWVFLNLVSWYSNSPNLVLLADKYSIIGILSLPLFVLFSLFYLNKQPKAITSLFVFLPVLPFLFLIGSSFNVKGISLPSCETEFGELYDYLTYLVAFYFLLVAYIYARELKKSGLLRATNAEQRKKILIVLGGILFFLLFSTVTNILPSFFGFDFLTAFTPLGPLAFIFACAYAIVRYQFLDLKLIATQVFVILIWIVIAAEFLFVRSVINYLLVGFTLFLSIILGVVLIKSVKNEIRRRGELQIMAAKLAQANAQLRELDSAKSEFISIASHQLRTPLTAVKGFVSMLLEGSFGKIVVKQKDVLQKVYTSNERLIHLVDDLLNLSRIEAGRMEYNFEDVQIEQVVKEVVDTLSVAGQEKGIPIKVNYPSKSLPTVRADKGKILEVISNLVDNAIKYSEKGEVGISMEQSADKLLLSVRDTGRGISTEELKRLFGKFSRGDRAERFYTEGAGLGLYVGRKITEAHGGRIWAESEGKGKGSTFYLELPFAGASSLS